MGHGKHPEHLTVFNIAISAGNSNATLFVAHILKLRLIKEHIHGVSGCQAPRQGDCSV